MVSYILWVVCLIISTLGVYSDSRDACKKFECPYYIVVGQTDSYEIRKYTQPYKMASAASKGLPYNESIFKNFWEVYKYQNGNNKEHRWIRRVVPIMNQFTIDIWPSGKEVLLNEFTTSFFIPQIIYEYPPEPIDDNVKIVNFPGGTAYAVRFHGFDDLDFNIARKLQLQLHQSLVNDGVSFDPSKFYTAVYDDLRQKTQRNNDIIYFE